MNQRAGLPEHVPLPEFFDDQGIGVLHEPAADYGHVRRELSARVYRLQEREPVQLAGRVVICAECG